MSQELSNIDYAKLAKVTAAEEKVAAVHLWKHKTQGKIADSKNKRLIILMGPPGSGKSSLAAKYQQQNPNLITIGRDDVYAYHPRMFELAAKRPVQLNSKELDCYDNPIFPPRNKTRCKKIKARNILKNLPRMSTSKR